MSRRDDWWPRYGPVIVGGAAGVFGGRWFDGEPVTGRTVIAWLVLTGIALAVTWLVYRLLDRRRRVQSG